MYKRQPDEVVNPEPVPANALDGSSDSGGGSVSVFLSLFLLFLVGLARGTVRPAFGA